MKLHPQQFLERRWESEAKVRLATMNSENL
jgi:hypothetical protein